MEAGTQSTGAPSKTLKNTFLSFGAFVLGKASKKNRFFLGKSPKLWVGGGQESQTFYEKKTMSYLFGIFDHSKHIIFS